MASRDIRRLRGISATIASSSLAYACGTVAPILVPRIALLAGHRALAQHLNPVVGAPHIFVPERGASKFGLITE